MRTDTIDLDSAPITVAELKQKATEAGIDYHHRIDLWREQLQQDDEVVDSLLQYTGAAPLPGRDPLALPELRWDKSPQVAQHDRIVRELPSIGCTFTAVFDRTTSQIDGPLADLDFAVKDLMEIRGHHMTSGTNAIRSQAAEHDAPTVSAIRHAGARLVGATNLHALAYGATGTSSDWGIPVNPADPGAIPGGSSSGSAVAVASGQVDVALGTDTAGSIRIPAALCGAVGFKPTINRLSKAGTRPLGPSLDHVGLLGRDVGIVGRTFDVLAGNVPGTSTARLQSGTLVVGVIGGHFQSLLTQTIRDTFHSVLKQLSSFLNVRLVDVKMPSATHTPGAQLATLSVEALQSNLGVLQDCAHELPEDVRLRLETGVGRTMSEYQLAQDFRRMWSQEVENALTRCHVLMCPTTTTTAPRLDQTTVDYGDQKLPRQLALTRLTAPFNLSGHPALSLPYSFDDGRTIGLQLIGPLGRDERLLRIATHVSQTVN